MNEKLKKLLCGVITASMVIGTVVLPAAADGLEDDLLLSITFDEGGTSGSSFTATKGGTVTKNGTVTFADSFDEEQGKALNIASKSASNYLTLPDGLLQGKQAATFSFWVKATSDTYPNWVFMNTCEESHTVNQEKYLGMRVATGSMNAERYNNTTSRLSGVDASSTDDWQYLTVVFETGGTRIYRSGKLIASDTVTVDVPALFTASSHTWIGHANWGGGEGFQGLIDDFKIYGKALSADEVKTDAAKAIAIETKKAVEEKNRLEIATNFYEGENKVFQANTYDVTIKTTVTNSTLTAKSLVFDVTAYDAQGEAFVKAAIVIPSHHKTLDVLDSAEFSETVTPSSDVAYYKVTVTDVTDGEKPVVYEAGLLPKADVSFPAASPEDTYGTTQAAHDPSIFKDPKTGVYYAYNTDAYGGEYTDVSTGTTMTDTYPMDTFKSTDLIHWERIDNNFRIPAKATSFFNEIFEAIGSHANTGVWAPDMFYAEEDTEHPYWLYYSLSTNGSNYDYIRSAIGLVKGATPEGPWTDCGIVVSSQNGNYNTNAIDSNIYVDTNGDRFFIWGSFQKGVHGVKLTSDGLAEGIDYTSNATIHKTSEKFGNRLFATPGGTMGPEGAWMINNADAASSDNKGYRYMFTSYGWLGTNYNIRVARNSLANTWADEIKSSSHHKLLDHKDRKVGTTYTEQPDKTELWGYKMLGSYQLGDGIIYYGNGHNSVLHDGDEWYLVEHCRKVPEGYATLQVRKMLWTDKGWPVVSPLVYAGEDEQTIPKELLYGTWDLSSVGQYITQNNKPLDVSIFDNKQLVDLPVLSSQIIIQPDGKISNYYGHEIGTWEYDDDHTLTINFSVTGEIDEYQFYTAGDTMKLFVLTGYDKDKKESALVMTGTDQNSIAQLAKKNNAVSEPTKNINHVDTTPVVIDKSEGGNPIVGMNNDGTVTYGGDPSVLVDGDTVYLYAGHDTATTEEYIIPEYICYSSKDLKNWTPHGSVFKVNKTTVAWARDNDTSAWAAQVLKHKDPTDGKDKYYLYYCTWANKNTYGEYQCIGVAVSEAPTGPFTNASTTPLINGRTMTTENTSTWNDIDPTGWIETDADDNEHIYLNWGNTENYTCELNSDMISVKDINGDGQITSADIKHSTFKNIEGVYTEAPYLYRRSDGNGGYTGKYYLFFAKDWREQWAYATTDDIMGGSWDYGSLMMQAPATSNTSHGAVFDFKGKTYYLYHNGSLPGGSGFRRVANIQELHFEADGSIAIMPEMSTGIGGTSSLITNDSGYISHEAFVNPLTDGYYPLKKSVQASAAVSDRLDAEWEIVKGKADTSNDNYVSIQSVNKPGLYISANGLNVELTQMWINKPHYAARMTFKTVDGLNGDDGSVSFESIMHPGYFLTVADGALKLTDAVDADACSFNITSADITDLAYAAGTLSFKLNSADIGDKVSAYIVAYNKGALAEVKISEATVDSPSKNISVQYSPSAEYDTIKLYVWKDMKPVSGSRDITSLIN